MLLKRSVSHLLRSQQQCTRSFSQSTTSPYTKRYALFSLLATASGISAAYFFLPDESRAAPTSRAQPLSPSHFTPVTVISNEQCGPNFKLMELEIPKALIPEGRDSIAPIWSVFIKDDDIQVERPYTPLHGIDDNGRMQFWIKKYPKGEVGRWLHTKANGDQIELRGPLQTWPWRDSAWDEVIMISGGTGVTPFYQLFHSLISNESVSPQTSFTLLHSSPTPEELPPRFMLNRMKDFSAAHPTRFRLRLHVDRLGDSTNKPDDGLTHGPISKEIIGKAIAGSDSTASWWARLSSSTQSTPKRNILVLVCGPTPMITSIAGPYGRNLAQGPVGGTLGELGLTSGNVWKF